jgi:3-hydroxyacyl-CoA dehydrogenase
VSARIETAAVLGAGVMGGGIAAHLANAGCRVLLLDLVPEGTRDRDALARAAIERLRKSDPPALMHPSAAALIEPGNLEDDLERLAGAQWVVEAVIEDLPTKQALLGRIAGHVRPTAVVSSNTSTLTLGALAHGLPAELRRRMLVTHFFNPPRYVRLLELVAGPESEPETVAALERFAEERLGKTVVRCADRPGFIANRIGCYWLLAAVAAARELGLTVEEADATASAVFGVPRTGVFGLLDLVGLDLVPSVAASLRAQLPADDPLHALPQEPPFLATMIAEGYTGRKGRGGFYRLAERAGERVKEARELATGVYRPAARVRIDGVKGRGDLLALLDRPDRLGRFADRLVTQTLAYAAHVMPELAADVDAIDRAMRLGYAWAQGPFEMLDRLGPERFVARLRRAGAAVPRLVDEVAGQRFYRPHDSGLAARARDGRYVELRPRPGTLRLADVRGRGSPVATNPSASLWDLGDGVACVEFHSKLNTLDTDSLAMLRRAVELVPTSFQALVIGNDADQFSAGANLGLALYAANLALWSRLEEIVRQGQAILQSLKYAPFPVVGAPSGLAVGGGCEVLLHCDAIEAHAESYVGLVEVGVGLIPAWGGTTQYLLRWLARPDRPGGAMPAVTKAFETIALAKVARSAAEARDLLFLRPSDGIVMHRDRVLAAAKARAIDLAQGYRPPEPPVVKLPGRAGRIALDLAVAGFRRLGRATAHDAVVARHLAEVLTGGDADVRAGVGEATLLELERRALMVLIRTPATLARMEHLLETGRPLRN